MSPMAALQQHLSDGMKPAGNLNNLLPNVAYSHMESELEDQPIIEEAGVAWSQGLFPHNGAATIVGETKHASSRTSSTRWLDHPLGTSLIIQMPWIGLSLLYFSVFELMTSYLTSMGVHNYVSRYLPSFLTFALAPIVGAASDRCRSKFGRRNHFMILAAIKLTISVLLFGASKTIFGDHLFLLSVNVLVIVWGTVSMEVALRARIFDDIPKEYQVQAQACGSIWHSVGVTLGMVLLGGGSKVVYGDQISELVLLRTCGIAVGAIVITVALSMYLKPERPLLQERLITVSIERFFKEIWDVIVTAPMEIKLLCLLQLVIWMAWYAFDNQKFTWWAEYVFLGCQQPTDNSTTACTNAHVALYMDGLDLARNAVQGISAVEFISTLAFFVVIPKNPTPTQLKRVNVTFMAIGVVMLFVAMIVGPRLHWLTFAAFIGVGTFFATIIILPFAMTGIIAKDFMDSGARFNNNGIYVALLMQFANCAKFTVENYNSSDISSFGTDNVLALPALLFVLSTIFTFFYKYEL
ncbi:Aste57867_11919 [Aphanomyces stellatus]|uniref:Aste57867_11919 protein n=1 Tax=Aphanomyces stellatus TaxID=120398 RepID=A0A485KUM5_9STRA|nr:hypothetical protein As57867_011874 [Aphanomyces stellatus]VFT88774.1 Aste57867_11919 [Aphanomyces stellatus]